MRLAEITTIPKLAKASGIPRRTLFRQLMALHAQHGGNWIFRFNNSIRINTVALRAAHPGMFEPADLTARVEDLEERAGEFDHGIMSNTRAIGQIVQRLETMDSERRLAKTG